MKLVEYWLEQIVNESIERLPSRVLAVDVGANAGTWSSPLSEVFENVIAVEPDPRVADQLLSLPDNVGIVRQAVADASGFRTFYARPSPEQNSLLAHHPIGAGSMAPAPVVATSEVLCTSLDDLCPQGADFVKIDIEGGEVLALEGCREVDRWDRTVFVVECHDTYEAVEEQLNRLNKRVVRVPHPLPGAHPQHCWAVGE